LVACLVVLSCLAVLGSSCLVLSGLAWLGLAWLGLAWLGLAWLGLAWLGLAWLGLARPGLAWPGLAHGLARMCLATYRSRRDKDEVKDRI
jgi:hypothetical protein